MKLPIIVQQEKMNELEFKRLKQEIVSDVTNIVKTVIEETKRENISEAVRVALMKAFESESFMYPIVRNSLAPLIKKAIIETDILEIPLTVSEYSVLAGVSPSAVYQRVHRNQLSYTKDGNAVLISPKMLNDILKAKSQKKRRAAN